MSVFLKTVVFALLASSFSSILFVDKNTSKSSTNHQHWLQAKALEEELCTEYALGNNLVLLTPDGQKIYNPNYTDLLQLESSLFSKNRVRVTITTKSDNNLCSTELNILNENGHLENNYSINACTSYGWIFFTDTDCFSLELYHDAGLEAPNGNDIEGSVDWTFRFNQEPVIKGIYKDMGIASMFNVANPCYNEETERPENAKAAVKLLSSKRRIR